MFIELSNISYTYAKGTPLSRQALCGISLKVGSGEWVAVMGPTGSGKSTLLQHFNGLLRPDCGEVLVNGTNIHSSAASLREARRNVGLVFQYPEHQLFAGRVSEEVAYGPENFGYSVPETEKKVREALATVGLDYYAYKDRSPHELSGGEKRRVALAGVLAVQPRVMVLDEPTAGLDRSGKEKFINTIKKLNRENGITVIWATHEAAEIAGLVNRIIVMDRGRIRLDGAVRDVLADPVMGELGLNIPVAVSVAGGLRKKGKIIEGKPVTVEEIKLEILKLVR